MTRSDYPAHCRRLWSLLRQRFSARPKWSLRTRATTRNRDWVPQASLPPPTVSLVCSCVCDSARRRGQPRGQGIRGPEPPGPTAPCGETGDTRRVGNPVPGGLRVRIPPRATMRNSRWSSSLGAAGPSRGSCTSGKPSAGRPYPGAPRCVGTARTATRRSGSSPCSALWSPRYVLSSISLLGIDMECTPWYIPSRYIPEGTQWTVGSNGECRSQPQARRSTKTARGACGARPAAVAATASTRSRRPAPAPTTKSRTWSASTSGRSSSR